ncbi:purine nucleoside phosphorylase [Linderina pennispora]|uniref:Purine nucleoside phosphorylase n=1 Tax=Linderina pennispora TaxID=61395 RepID=A0A1Y1WM54_9FUNG|nr:purine nucleoside phosphorylase [Linderina pennispora]ORX74629.1 purine nucleoside phosphorylase [Linderina pennispora]
MASQIPYETYQASATYLKSQIGDFAPTIGIICGSGLGTLADTLRGLALVEGHKGQLVFGTLAGKSVVCMQGRFHCYEGYSVQQATFPVRVFHLLGVKTLLVTNAAGGVNPAYENALIGPNIPEFGVRFPSISDLYTPSLRRTAAKAFLQNKRLREERGFRVHEGIYAWCFGPCFESRAELRALKTLGADLVGMSTVPEAVVAKHCGMEVLAMSLVTNKCAELRGETLEVVQEVFPHHEEVMAAAAARTPDIQEFVRSVIRDI